MLNVRISIFIIKILWHSKYHKWGLSESKKEDRPSNSLPGMQTPDEVESQDKTATGFSTGENIQLYRNID